MKMSLKLGTKAPAFTLVDQNGQKVSLKDFKGKNHVILYFYPKAMTPGCTTQACGLRDFKSELKKRKAIAIGISPDEPARLKKFEEKYDLNFTLLSDPDHSIALKYHSFGPKKFMGKEYDGILRQTFIIDQDGKLTHIMDKVKTKTHHQDVLNYLDEHVL